MFIFSIFNLQLVGDGAMGWLLRPGSQSGNHHHGPWQLFTLSFFIFYAQLCLGPSVLVLVFWHFVEAWCSATSTTMMTVAGALGCLGGEGLAFVGLLWAWSCNIAHWHIAFMVAAVGLWQQHSPTWFTWSSGSKFFTSQINCQALHHFNCQLSLASWMPPSIALNLIEEEFKDLFTSLPMLSLEREGLCRRLPNLLAFL